MATCGSRARGWERGTATVEAVVALPTLVLLFIAVFFVRDLTTGKHEALITARTCAWRYSMSNCDVVPPGCEGVLRDASSFDYENDEIRQNTNRIGGGAVGGFVLSTLSPFLDAVFGKAAAADVNRSVPRPQLFGGKTTSVAGHYHLACNVSETTLESMATSTWKALSPF